MHRQALINFCRNIFSREFRRQVARDVEQLERYRGIRSRIFRNRNLRDPNGKRWILSDTDLAITLSDLENWFLHRKDIQQRPIDKELYEETIRHLDDIVKSGVGSCQDACRHLRDIMAHDPSWRLTHRYDDVLDDAPVEVVWEA